MFSAQETFKPSLNPSLPANIHNNPNLVHSCRCLSFDCGLAGALHVAPSTKGTPVPNLPPVAAPSSSSGNQGGKERESEDDYFSPQNLVLAVLAPLLTRPSGTDGGAGDAHVAHGNFSALGDSEGGREAVRPTQLGPSPEGTSARSEKAGDSSTSSNSEGFGLDGLVLDDDSPFVGLFRELELLERVCDADWLRFEPACSGSGSGSGRAATLPVDRVDSKLPGEGGPLPSSLASMVMCP